MSTVLRNIPALAVISLFLHSAAMAAQPLKLTGRYDNSPGALQNTLFVKQLGPDKIQFGMTSLWVGNAKTGQVHTGSASGTMTLKNNEGTFQQGSPGYKLTFKFSPKRCKVTCTDTNYYGGMNVDPDGVYTKSNSKVPSDADLNPPQ